ncbi:MAG: hypothetical protein ACI9XP_001931 [Lentimonas sp.]|jgi:hypothetical protein
MKIQFLSKTTQNKRFDYSPMYYDERKEKLELKKKEFSGLSSNNLSPSDRKDILRRNMQTTWQKNQQGQKARKTSNMRVLMLIGIILILGYFIFNGLDEVDTVVKKLW